MVRAVVGSAFGILAVEHPRLTSGEYYAYTVTDRDSVAQEWVGSWVLVWLLGRHTLLATLLGISLDALGHWVSGWRFWAVWAALRYDAHLVGLLYCPCVSRCLFVPIGCHLSHSLMWLLCSPVLTGIRFCIRAHSRCLVSPCVLLCRDAHRPVSTNDLSCVDLDTCSVDWCNVLSPHTYRLLLSLRLTHALWCRLMHSL